LSSPSLAGTPAAVSAAKTAKPAPAPSQWACLAVAARNGLPESWHLGAVAVATAAGRLVASAGDAGLETFARSAAKPWQAVPFVLAGGMERYGLEAVDLALLCSSHGGTVAHARRAELILGRGGLRAPALLCGAHEPFDEAAAQGLRRAGDYPSALHNNCSGKHAGMLLHCELRGWETEDYIAPEHPLQREVLAQVASFCGVAESAIGIAVDGCSAPTHRLPLRAVARGYAALAAPRAAALPGAVVGAAERIVAAMAAAPEMVAGPGRFTTRLIEVTDGRVIGKEGAEGFYAVAIREPSPLGVAIKIADGGERCRDGVVIEVLRQLGSLSASELAALAEFMTTAVLSRRGDVVGEIRPVVQLDLSG
jgi:L-asparaginase II